MPGDDADVPALVDVEQVATGVRPAQVFTRRYAECADTENWWGEPVAIVVFDEPAHADLPTMVLRGDKAESAGAVVTDIVSWLEPVSADAG